MKKFSENYIEGLEKQGQATNSQGKPVSPKHLQEKEKTMTYINDMKQLLDKYPENNRGEEFAKAYNEVWNKHFPDKTHQQPSAKPASYGKGKDVPDDQFDAEQLAKGTKIEMEEHGLDMETAKGICKDHLLEDENYYKDEQS